MYSDKVGRKAAMSASILTMCAGTALTELTPGYATIGMAASLLILLGRLSRVFGGWRVWVVSCVHARVYSAWARGFLCQLAL